MSLIQEALRRKDDDAIHPDTAMPPRFIPQTRDAAAVREAPRAQEVPPVMKLPSRKPPKSSKAWVTVLVALLIVVALLAGAFALFMYSAGRLSETTAELPVSGSVVRPAEIAVAEPMPAAPAAQPVAPPARESAGSSPQPVVVEAEKPARAVRPAIPEPSPEKPTVATRPPAVEIPKPVPPPPKPPVVTAVPKKSLDGVKTVSAAVSASSSWPRLSLHGTMAQTSPTQGSAMINGTVVEVGEKIEGCRLLEVHRNGVLLEFKGETQFVRVGQSTF